ncbi:MAG: FAD binding domain-containing protein [Bacteroidetes bacterium]|nr:FAD binding domain-containing protein [Bacteroidota bacterium]
MKRRLNFILNKNEVETSQHPGMSLLDYLRQEAHLTGTKEGCKEGDCGTCTVLIGELVNDQIKYKAVNSCLLPIGDVDQKHIVTIEGLNREELTPIQTEMVDEGGTQCGFCTPGFVVSLSGYYLINDNYNTEDAIDSMNGNICRCTGYAGIKRTARKITQKLNVALKNNHFKIELLVMEKILPEYFLDVKEMLGSLILQKESNITDDNLDFSNRFTISGGTDLMVQKWEDILKSDVTLISDKNVISGIKEENSKIIIGGATTASEIEDSPIMAKYFPEIKEYLSLFGSLPIKNTATVAGNIVNASPIADMTSIFLALNSTLTLRNSNSSREILLKDFYIGYKTLDKKENELLTLISFNIPKENSFFNYEKVSKRKYLDIASVNSSLFIDVDEDFINEVNISAGGVAPIPLYLKETGKFLSSKKISSAIIEEASEILQDEISPISDARGTAEYKRLLLRQLFYAHFIKLFPKLIIIEELV